MQHTTAIRFTIRKVIGQCVFAAIVCGKNNQNIIENLIAVSLKYRNLYCLMIAWKLIDKSTLSEYTNNALSQIFNVRFSNNLYCFCVSVFAKKLTKQHLIL